MAKHSNLFVTLIYCLSSNVVMNHVWVYASHRKHPSQCRPPRWLYMGTDCSKAPVIISFKATEYRSLYHVMLEVSLINNGIPRYLDSSFDVLLTGHLSIILVFLFSAALLPNVGQGLLILEVSRSHTKTHHRR